MENKGLRVHRTSAGYKPEEAASPTQQSTAQEYLDIAAVIILALDVRGEVTLINKKGCEILGYREEEIIGKRWFDTFVPKDRVAELEDLEQKLLSGDINSVEYYENPVLTRSGEERLIAWHNTVLTDEAGKFTGCLSSGTDITEREMAEEKHRTILKTTRDGFWMVDLEGKMLEVNDSYCKMMGYTREELLKMSIMDVEVLENPDDILRRIRKIAEQGSDRFETRHRGKQGRIIDVEVSANYLDMGDGQISVFVRDITRRKQVMERIDHLNRTLRSILTINQLITREKDRDRLLKGICENLIACGCCCTAWVAMLDESGKLITHGVAGFHGDFSPMVAMLREGKLPPCARKTMSQSQVIITKDPPAMCLGCPLRPDETAAGGMAVRLAHGDKTYGILCAAVLPETLVDKDEIALFKEVADDIAYALYNMELAVQNELLEEERLRSAKLESIGTLAGGIAHDFNNLLTGIMGNIGLAKLYVEPESNVFGTLDEAESAAGRARELTQQLLTFAKGGKPVKKTIEIAGLVKESATFALRGSSVRLELSLPEDLCPVEVDEGQINQVIQNIVINADESMPNGGVLRIGAENMRVKKGSLPLPAGEYVRLEIADEGTGISKKDLQRIFEPYFTTKQKGSGLGLSTVYSIVRKHSGYITAESVLGRGTAFRIYLPASEKPLPDKGNPAADQTGRKGGRVLVMDDEEIIRKMLVNMLKVIGYEVETTSEGTEALEVYRRALESGRPFDAVIMDLTIPGGMGGKEAVGKVLEMDPGARVIVSSGYATDAIMSEYKQYGFSAVIAKPYSIDQLEETLNSLPRRG
jgi:PAS domain S-box-containing protein